LSFSEDRIKLFQDICDNLENGYSIDSLRYVNMIFSHFLTSLIYEDRFNHENNKGECDIVAKSIKFMQDNSTKCIRLDDLSTFVNLSTSHFSAIFKENTGYSPNEYFNHLKIQKACQDISFTNMPIKAIANSLGIEDQYYFTRLFTKLMGNSPSEYRKKKSQTNNNCLQVPYCIPPT